MQRYFAQITNNKPVLTSEDIHHITHVMRMRVGETFEVIDIEQVYICLIKSINPFDVEILSKKKEDVELKSKVTLFFALAKGDKIDFVIQKATELGVSRIVLFKSKRCVVNFDSKDFEKKLPRFNKIAKEAAEQCHRLVIPEIVGVIDFKSIDSYLAEKNYVAYEKEAGNTTNSFEFDSKVKSLSIMIGSEGGFDEDEITLLKQKGFTSISLGKRILRCETAAVYALSVISYLLEK